MTPSALFRADAGQGIGLGHLQRTLALAHAFRRRGITGSVLAPEAQGVRRRVERAGCAFVPLATDPVALGASSDCEQVISEARARACRFVVIDSYRIDARYLRSVREVGCPLVVFDDFDWMRADADVVIDSAVRADAPSHPQEKSGATLLLGPRYAVLHPAFWDSHDRAVRPEVRRILVAVGGSDPRGLMPQLLNWVDGLAGVFEIVAVIGPFSTVGRLEATSHPVVIAHAPDHLCQLLSDADLVVTGAGQTLYEALAVGTPAVAIELFANQAATLYGFEAAGVVRRAGAWDDSDLRERVQAALADLMRRPGVRQQLVDAGRLLVDGRGALRSADAVLRVIGPSGGDE